MALNHEKCISLGLLASDKSHKLLTEAFEFDQKNPVTL